MFDVRCGFIPAIVVAVLFGVGGGGSALGQAALIGEGTGQWVEAAQTGRADMLILGDSMVWFQGHGWDAAFNAAAHQTVGLAGSGLVRGLNSEGEGYTPTGAWGSGWQHELEAVPPDRQDYAVGGRAVTAGAVTAGNFGFAIDGTTLDPAGAYEYHIWTASPDGGGAMGAYRRLGAAPWTRMATHPVTVTATPAEGLQHTMFHFDGVTGPSQPNQLLLEQVENTSVLYSRLLSPGAAGVTVSSWGYGGKSTLAFYNEQYAGGTLSERGRNAWLSAMVEGGSGKLNVVLAEGFNDRNETSPSLAGNPNGNSPPAFADNINALIDRIRLDWAGAGKTAADLSFTLLGMYEVATGNDLLRDYAAELRSIALGDPLISFIDLYQIGPSYQQAVQLGYMQDSVHLNREGTLLYGQLVMDALLAPPLPGDANRDGRVDGEDFLIWQAGFGTQAGGMWEQGDFNGDGRVDGEDFLIWQAHFGSVATATMAVTPEPAAAAVLALAGLLALRRQKDERGPRIT